MIISGNNPGGAEVLASGEAIFARVDALSTITLVSGTLALSYWTAVTSGQPLSVITATVDTAASGLTYAALGVYSVDANGNLTLIGSTGDQHSSLWVSTFATYTTALSFARQAGQRYALGALAIGTTPPKLGAAGDYFAFGPYAPTIFASLSGQSALPASISAGSLSMGQSTGVEAIVTP